MKKIFHPGKYLLVDEIMPAWVGLCALFTAFGIPHLTKIARKPQGVGAEMKAVACGDSGMLLGLDIQEGKERNSQKKYVAAYGAGAAVVLLLCEHWLGVYRIVVVDSACASRKLLIALLALFGMAMMGAVKTASTGFPKKWLSDYHAYGTQRDEQGNQKLPRGSWVVLESKYTVCNSTVERVMYAVGWLDKKLKAIICNCSTTLKALSDSVRRRHRKVERDGEYFTESVYLNIPRPQAIADFFHAFSVIDIHDHIRQGILGMERYWLTKVWWKRIYGTVYAVYVVNAYVGCRWESIREGTSTSEDFIIFEEFAERLSYQMIFNVYLEDNDGVTTRSSRLESSSTAPSTPHNPVSQSSAAQPKRHEIETLKSIGKGKKRCKYPNCHQDAYYYCKTCSIDGKIHSFCGFKSSSKCAYNHVIEMQN